VGDDKKKKKVAGKLNELHNLNNLRGNLEINRLDQVRDVKLESHDVNLVFSRQEIPRVFGFKLGAESGQKYRRQQPTTVGKSSAAPTSKKTKCGGVSW
jgi:hypothetical protein